MSLSEELYRRIEQAGNSGNEAGLKELAPEIFNYASERSWLIASYADAWERVKGSEGIIIASNVLKMGRGVLRNYVTVVRRYGHLKKRYPGVTFSYFAYLYFYGVPNEVVDEIMKIASEEHSSLAEFQSFLRDMFSKGDRKSVV